MADKATGVRNGPETRFALGSITKMFTATGIHQLVQQNTLKYHDTLGAHLDGFPAEIADTVTIHHMLTTPPAWATSMHQQLNHLVSLSQLNHINIVVLPFNAGAHLLCTAPAPCFGSLSRPTQMSRMSNTAEGVFTWRSRPTSVTMSRFSITFVRGHSGQTSHAP